MRRRLPLLICLLLIAAPWAAAQDPTEVDPDHYSVVFENDQVRVLRISYRPGEKSVMHFHRPGPVIYHNAAKAHMTFPDGSTMVTEGAEGEVAWSPGGLHQPASVSDEPFVVFQVELKGADSAELAAIGKVRAMEVASVTEASPDSIYDVYASNVEFVPPGEAVVQGADAVREWFVALLEQYTADLEYTDSDVQVAGDWAFERFAGTITLTPKTEGEPVVEHLRGLHVYHRGEDGSWKITHDVWSPGPP